MGRQKKIKSLGSYKPSKSIGGKKKSRINRDNAHKPSPNNLNNRNAALDYGYNQELGSLEQPEFDPVDTFNTESQYKRYEKGTRLVSIKVEQSEGETPYHVNNQYYFDAYSKTTSGNWIVSVVEKNHYVNIEKSIILLCSGQFTLTEEELDTNIDNEDVVWEQVSGNRTVTISPNETYATFTIEANCFTAACQDEEDRNIVLKIYPEGEEYLFDYFVIYTVPSSFLVSPRLSNISYDWNPLQDIGSHLRFIPIYTQRAFQWTSGTLPIKWTNSSFFSEHDYVGSYLLTNTTGEYLVSSSLITNNIFNIVFGNFYKILSYYEDAKDPIISRRLHYPSPSDTLSYYFGNDSSIKNYSIFHGRQIDEQLNISSALYNGNDYLLFTLSFGKKEETFFNLTSKSYTVIDVSPVRINAIDILRSIVDESERSLVDTERRKLVKQEINIENTVTRVVSTILFGSMSHEFVTTDGSIIG